MLHGIKLPYAIAFIARAASLNAALTQHRLLGIVKCRYSTRVRELQKQIEIETKRGRDAVQLKESLCMAYIKEKNVEKLEELTKTCTFSDFVYHSIINMYTEMGSTELALSQFDRVRSVRQNYKLPVNETARLAHTMFKENREWGEIIRLFMENKQQRSEGRNMSETHVFLQTVASTGKPAELAELFDVMVANNFLVKDSNAAGFMVKVHLVNKDLPSAVQTFERQFEERKFTSNHLPLMIALIVANDMEGLRKVFKCMQLKYSNGDAVLALVTSFLQIGNIEQARIVLKHCKSHITDYHFRKHCERYCKYNEHNLLEKLISATTDLEYDRSTIYSILLGRYCAQKETNKALDLWRTQRDQNEQPSNDFLQALAFYLRENGLKIPFAIPGNGQPLAAANVSREGVTETKTAVKVGDVDAALEHWTRVDPKSTQYPNLSSQLVQLLSKSQSDRKKEAVDVAIQSIKLNRKVSDLALRDLIQRLSKDGDTQLLERLGDMLPTSTKRSIQFGWELLKAYEKSGQWDEFFSITLKKTRMNANMNDRIPMERLLTLLQKQILPLEEFEKFAADATDAGSCQPLNVLWAHYFLIDSPKSSSLYDRIEQYYPEKFEVAFAGSFLAGMEDDEKLERLLVFVRAKCERQLAAVNIVTLISRMTK